MKSSVLLSLSALALSALLPCVSSAQAIIINPVSATESSHDTAFGASILATINGSGLSSTSTVNTGGDPSTGFSGVTHDTSSGNMWRTFVASNGFGAPVDPNAVLTWDLGATYNLTGIYYWNYNEFTEIDRGIRNVNISTSADGVNFSTPTLVTLAQSGGSFSDPGASLSLTALNAQYVRFEVISNYGDPDLAGLGEVRFIGTAAIPEPSSYALILGGVACVFSLGLRRRVSRL
jgi:hypothetical protein